MNDLWVTMSLLQKILTLCAIFGGGLSLVQILLLFVVGETEGHHLFSTDTHSNGFSIGDMDVGFKWLSLQGIATFFLTFGLGGLALLSSGVPPLLTLLGTTAIGLASVWTIASIFNLSRKLNTSGNLDYQKAVGKEGSIYLTIPAANLGLSTGQVEIGFQKGLRICDAASEKGEEIKTGERVRVIRVTEGNILVVSKI